MQVGSAAHLDPAARRQDVIQGKTRRADTAFGLAIKGNDRLAIGRCGPPSAQPLDQVAHRLFTVAMDRWPLAQGCSHNFAADDDDPQVIAWRERLDQHVGAIGPRRLDGRIEIGLLADIDGNTAPLFAARRLDDDRTGPVKQISRGLAIVAVNGFRNRQADLGHQPPRHRLVVAAAHRDCARQLAEGLAADDGPPAMRQTEEAALGIEHINGDAAPPGLVDNDPRIGVQPGFKRLTGEQLFVDRVLALHREGRRALKSHAFIEPDGGFVVVDHGQVHVAATARREMRGQMPGQRLADLCVAGAVIDRKAPQGGPALRVIEGPLMVDTRDRPDDLAGLGVLGDKIGQRAVVPVFPEEFRVDADHPAGRIDPVDGFGVGLRAQLADHEAARRIRVQPRG